MAKYIKQVMTVTTYSEVTDAPYYQENHPDLVLAETIDSIKADPWMFLDYEGKHTNIKVTAEYVTELPHQHEEESE